MHIYLNPEGPLKMDHPQKLLTSKLITYHMNNPGWTNKRGKVLLACVPWAIFERKKTNAAKKVEQMTYYKWAHYSHLKRYWQHDGQQNDTRKKNGKKNNSMSVLND